MLRRSLILPKFSRNLNFCRANFSSKATKKVLGYNEKPDVSEITADYIGPPDKKSNIRPILRHIPENETELQYELRIRRAEVHDWVDKFWKNHNYRFITEKDEFIEAHKVAGEESVPADKMSVFYKAFLDKNWKVHAYFNISWYIKNFELMFLALQVNIQSGFNKVKKTLKN